MNVSCDFYISIITTSSNYHDDFPQVVNVSALSDLDMRYISLTKKKYATYFDIIYRFRALTFTLRCFFNRFLRFF